MAVSATFECQKIYSECLYMNNGLKINESQFVYFCISGWRVM